MRALKIPLILITAGIVVPGQVRSGPTQTLRTPSPVKLSRNAAGNLSATAPFTLHPGPGFPTAEVAIEPETGKLRVTCAWDSDVQLLVSITGAAGHGLPGRVNLTTQMGASPQTLEIELSPEQVARGSVYVEVTRGPFQRGGRGVVHGTIAVTLTGTGREEQPGEERLPSALEEGKLLSKSEVDALEAKLKNHPNDWPARIKLISYYSSSATLHMNRSQIIAARRRHILWAIENRSAVPEVFSMAEFQISDRGPMADLAGVREAKQAWRQAVADHPQGTEMLLNAAMFFAETDPEFSEWALLEAKSRSRGDAHLESVLGWLYATSIVSGTHSSFASHARSLLTTSDNADLIAAAVPVLAWPEASLSGTQIRFQRPKQLDLAEELAERAESLNPQNPYGLVPLFQALTIRMVTAETRDEKADANKRMYEAAKRFNDFVMGPASRLLLLPMLADLAFDADDYDAAQKYAMQALDLVPYQSEQVIQGVAVGPEAIHDANDVLGRIALRRGNLQQAEDFLLEAAATPGGGLLNHSGPRMLLAQELLDRGERDVVIEYLQKVKAFWGSGAKSIDGWISAIRSGKRARLNLVEMPMLTVPSTQVPLRAH